MARVLLGSALYAGLAAFAPCGAAAGPSDDASFEAERIALALADEAAKRNLSKPELAQVAAFEGARMAYLIRVAERPNAAGPPTDGTPLRLPGVSDAPLTRALDEFIFNRNRPERDAKWAVEFVRRHGQSAVTASVIVGFGESDPAILAAWEASGRPNENNSRGLVWEYYRLRREEPRGLAAKVRFLTEEAIGFSRPAVHRRFHDLGKSACDELVDILKRRVAKGDPRSGRTAEIAVEYLVNMRPS